MRCAILFEQKRSSAFAYALVAQLDRAVSYTHLDVYKRQIQQIKAHGIRRAHQSEFHFIIKTGLTFLWKKI